VQVKPFSRRDVLPVMQMPSDWQSAPAKPRLSSARGFLPGKQKLQGWRLEPVKSRLFYDRVSPVKRRPPGSPLLPVTFQLFCARALWQATPKLRGW